MVNTVAMDLPGSGREWAWLYLVFLCGVTASHDWFWKRIWKMDRICARWCCSVLWGWQPAE
jgi:hypothetical protein